MRFPSVNCSQLPTPIHRLDNLSQALGIDLWIKRDDLTGFAFGGNKTRKLDLLLADAVEKKADTLIAVGSTQSNFCRIAAAYGSRFGLETHLVIGPKPVRSTGNFRMMQLFGATIHHYDSHDWHWLEEESLRLAERLRDQGKNVYPLPVGGSTPLGDVGYVDAIREIQTWERQHDTTFDALYVTTGSGGTHAGLIAGKAKYNWPTNIIGMSISISAEKKIPRVIELAHATASLVEAAIDPDTVQIDDRFIGPGYGQKTGAAERAITTFALWEGIMLDSYYTGKAAAGLIEHISEGRITPGQRVLFLHTGGNIQLFE